MSSDVYEVCMSYREPRASVWSWRSGRGLGSHLQHPRVPVADCSECQFTIWILVKRRAALQVCCRKSGVPVRSVFLYWPRWDQETSNEISRGEIGTSTNSTTVWPLFSTSVGHVSATQTFCRCTQTFDQIGKIYIFYKSVYSLLREITINWNTELDKPGHLVESRVKLAKTWSQPLADAKERSKNMSFGHMEQAPSAKGQPSGWSLAGESGMGSKRHCFP